MSSRARPGQVLPCHCNVPTERRFIGTRVTNALVIACEYPRDGSRLFPTFRVVLAGEDRVRAAYDFIWTDPRTAEQATRLRLRDD